MSGDLGQIETFGNNAVYRGAATVYEIGDDPYAFYDPGEIDGEIVIGGFFSKIKKAVKKAKKTVRKVSKAAKKAGK